MLCGRGSRTSSSGSSGRRRSARRWSQPNRSLRRNDVAADETARASGTQVQFLSVFLMAFALVALVVGSFVIYNTFSITVAQRTKEIAVLRSLGASRRQVMRSVRFEAFFTGMFASAVGVVVGIATAQGLRAALHAFGVELPGGSVVIAPRTIVQAMVVGVVVTVVAAWLPSRRTSLGPT